MGIERLSTNALNRLVNGNHDSDETCVVKFYSNGCHFCHALKDVYLGVHQEHIDSGIHFFAFNVDDLPAQSLDHLMGANNVINGVPSIIVVNTGELSRDRRIKIMNDPKTPDQDTYYTQKQISDFVKSSAKTDPETFTYDK